MGPLAPRLIFLAHLTESPVGLCHDLSPLSPEAP